LRSHDGTFGSNCTSRTFNALLLALHISDTTLRRLNNTGSWLFHPSRLFHRSRLFCGPRLFHLALLFHFLGRLWRRTATILSLTLVSHLEFLSLRTIRHRIHAHCLGKIRTERRCCGRRARNYRRIA
jgi:hypothetical protein